MLLKPKPSGISSPSDCRSCSDASHCLSTVSDPGAVVENSDAKHVVAAAPTAAVLDEASPAKWLTAMVGMLNIVYDDNPSWGPLFVGHRGDRVRHVVAIRR